VKPESLSDDPPRGALARTAGPGGLPPAQPDAAALTAFWRDLAIVPHLFLWPGRIAMAPLLASAETVREALGGAGDRTLDTAARRVAGVGIFRAADLTAYCRPRSSWRRLQDGGVVGPVKRPASPWSRSTSRPPMLLAHDPQGDPIPAVELPGGAAWVPWISSPAT